MEMKKKKLKVAVLAGGIGTERQISLQSGENVFEALKESGIETILSDISPDDTSILEDEDFDVFFLALHGQFGEDGGLTFNSGVYIQTESDAQIHVTMVYKIIPTDL